MRILFVNSVADRAGGASSAVALATALADAGHSVTLACSRRGDLARRLAERPGIRTHAVRFGPDFDPLAAAALARLARNVRPDVILADRRKDVKLLSLARAFGLRSPVVHRHGAPSVLRDGPVYRHVWRRIAAMIVNSRAMRAALLDATPWLAHTPLHVVPNGVDTAHFRPLPDARTAMRAELDIPATAFVIAFAGALQPRKRLDLLIRAAALAAHPLHVLIIGDGPERPALHALARRLGVAATFTGHRTDLPEVLAAADGAAHLSAAEGFSNSVLECLACGLPVVATAEHSHPEQIDHDVTGLLVAPHDAAVAAAFETLRMHPAQRDALARAARESALHRFGLEAMARGYTAILQSVLPATPTR